MAEDSSKTYVPRPSAGVSGMKSRQSVKNVAMQQVHDAKRRATAEGREYKGPTLEQAAAGTLKTGVSSTVHRQQARTAALTLSGIRGGQTGAVAAAEATKTVYGVKSSQAKAAQVILNKERAKITAALKKKLEEKQPLKIPLTPAQIHKREKLFAAAERETFLEAIKGKRGEILKYQVEPTKKKNIEEWNRVRSMEYKLKKKSAQLSSAEHQLNKWDSHIKNGKFVGTEFQYKKYSTDFKNYDKVATRYSNTYSTYEKQFKTAESTQKQLGEQVTSARRARFGGLTGIYEDIETKVSKKIPTLQDISKKGAEFQRKHPEVASKIYTSFKKAHAKTERVGTQSQKDALAGYTYGSYQSIQKQPVKTAAMVAVGMGSVKALGVVGKIGKAYGAGAKTARVAQAAQLGLLGLYGKQSVDHIMAAPNSYVAGQRAAKIVYTELLPLVAGVKVAEVAPKVARVVIKRGKLTAKEFEVGSRRLLKDTEAKTHMSFGKTKKQKLEDAIKSMEKKKGESLTTSEIRTMEKTFGTKRLRTAEDIHKKRQVERKAEEAERKRKIASGEYKEVKIGKGAQQQIQLVKVKPKVTTKQQIKLTKQKLIAHEQEMMALANAMPSFKRISKVNQIQKVKVVTKTEQQVITRLAQKHKQVIAAATRTKIAVKTATKTAQKVKAEVRTATKAKVKTKAQQKTKLATLIALRRATQTDVQLLTKALAQLKAATKEIQQIKPAAAMVTATTTKSRTLTDLDTLKRIVRKAIAEQKKAVRELTSAIGRIQAIELIVPPVLLKPRIPTKKKIIKKKIKKEQILNQKNLNAVATFRQVLGGL